MNHRGRRNKVEPIHYYYYSLYQLPVVTRILPELMVAQHAKNKTSERYMIVLRAIRWRGGFVLSISTRLQQLMRVTT